MQRTTRQTPGSLGLVLVATAAVVIAALAPAVGRAADVITMKLGTATVNDVQVEAIKRFGERVEKRSQGRIKAEVYPGAQLGSNARMIEGLQFGTLEVYVGPPAYLVGVDPRFQVLDAPGVFDDMDHARRTITDPEFWDAFLSLGEQKGLVGVSLFIYSPTSWATREPLRDLEDFEGLKLRVMASEMERKATGGLGATAVPIDFSEVVPALQQGTVDGMKSGMSAFTAIKVYDVVKYATLTHEAIIPEVMMVSKSWFDRLPPDLQAILVEEGKAIEPGLYEYTVREQEKAKKIWRQNGGELIELSPAERARMMKQLSTVAGAVLGNEPKVSKMYQLLVRIADKHRRH